MIRFIIVDDEVDMQKRMKNIILKETFNLKEEIEIKYFNKYNNYKFCKWHKIEWKLVDMQRK